MSLRTVVLLVLLVANEGGSQTVWGPAVFIPTSPTSQNGIVARFDIPWGCSGRASTVVAGSLVTTTVMIIGCITGPPTSPGLLDDDFGPLPAGTYTYEIYFVYQSSPTEFRSRQTLVVADPPAPIPLFSGWALVALGVTLALVAFLRMDFA